MIELATQLDNAQMRLENAQNILIILNEHLSDESAPTKIMDEKMTGVILIQRMDLFISLLDAAQDIVEAQAQEIGKISEALNKLDYQSKQVTV